MLNASHGCRRARPLVKVHVNECAGAPRLKHHHHPHRWTAGAAGAGKLLHINAAAQPTTAWLSRRGRWHWWRRWWWWRRRCESGAADYGQLLLWSAASQRHPGRHLGLRWPLKLERKRTHLTATRAAFDTHRADRFAHSVYRACGTVLHLDLSTARPRANLECDSDASRAFAMAALRSR